MRVKEVPVTFKAGPDDGLADGEFVVYPSTFTRTPDSYGDVVAKGAFADDIARWKDSGNVLPGLYGHRMDDPDFFVASAIEMSEDEHGWRIKGVFDLDSPKGPQVYRLVKGRRISQLSFAYDVEDEGEVELEDGTKANELRKLKTYEFSFVPVGANQDTSVVAVKSAVAALEQVKRKAAGDSLSDDNQKSLRDARDAIDSVLTSLDSAAEDELPADSGEDDQEKASGTTEAKPSATDEDPTAGKSAASGEEPKSTPSARALAALSIRERN